MRYRRRRTIGFKRRRRIRRRRGRFVNRYSMRVGRRR